MPTTVLTISMDARANVSMALQTSGRAGMNRFGLSIFDVTFAIVAKGRLGKC